MVVQKRVSMLFGVNLQNGVSQSQLTFLIKVPSTAVRAVKWFGVKLASRRPKERRSTEKCDREA
jgi:hypothetical protein